MASYTFFHLLLLVLLFSSHEIEKRCSWGREMANHEEHDTYAVEMKSLTPATTCKGKAQKRGLTLAHRQGPCSPLAAHRQSRDSKGIFLRDQARVHSINILRQSRMLIAGNHGENARLPIRSSSPRASEFVVTIGLGTPKVDLTLIFDTGSDITWTQCKPCLGCYPQKDPLFEPSKSTTSSPCSASNCTYSIDYADGSHSNGYYVRDLLTLTPEYQFQDFIFGCSENNSHDFGATSGILGLGQGDKTLISRVEQKFSNIFCYCIPGSKNSNGYLLFGFDALSNCQTENITPLIIDQHEPSFYFVNLVGIALGNQKFSLSSESPPPKTIIDSGTTFTRLPPSIYNAVREEFDKYMSKYPRAKSPSTVWTLDTCYDLRGQENVNLPTVTLQFEKTNVTLDPSAIVWRVNDDDAQVCLAFKPNPKRPDQAIIGNAQQRNLNILFNIRDEEFHFGRGDCAN
ncbi:hypothetical protein BT93_D1910 [Corymbia citriodora subsp. variegata]|nr:hypothetical protein BT93_D1910 [Corymbia citriodora subsp. variegata]